MEGEHNKVCKTPIYLRKATYSYEKRLKEENGPLYEKIKEYRRNYYIRKREQKELNKKNDLNNSSNEPIFE